MNKQLFCHVCDDYKDVEIITKEETYKVKNDEVKILANICRCVICGEELFDTEIDNNNLEKAYEVYRKRHSLLSSKDVKNIRETYGLSQRTLGKILGWGEITIHRYEKGALPEQSHNKILKLLENPEVMKELLLEAKDNIPNTTFKNSMDKINAIIDEREEDKFLELLQKNLANEEINEECGFKQVSLTKVINYILYFAENVPQLWKTKLNKLLFYTDFSFFKEYIMSLTGLKYLKFQYGPVPKEYEGIVWYLEKLGFIQAIPTETYNYPGEIIIPLCQHDPDVFSDEEYQILEKVKNKYGNYNSKDISEVSHQEKGWLETPLNNVISYNYAAYLND